MHPYPTRVRHFNHKGLHHLQFELAKTFVVKHLTLYRYLTLVYCYTNAHHQSICQLHCLLMENSCIELCYVKVKIVTKVSPQATCK